MISSITDDINKELAKAMLEMAFDLIEDRVLVADQKNAYWRDLNAAGARVEQNI